MLIVKIACPAMLLVKPLVMHYVYGSHDEEHDHKTEAKMPHIQYD